MIILSILNVNLMREKVGRPAPCGNREGTQPTVIGLHKSGYGLVQ